MNNTKIEWADMTWNPVTGCLHGCSYCYARRIANRFASKDPEAVIQTTNYAATHVLQDPYVYDGKIEPYPFGFEPTLHMYRMKEPSEVKEPKRIFVCSMSDLFGAWVPDWWILSILEACRRAPWHKYLFLTKNPFRYDELIDDGVIRPDDDNFWLGSTVTDLTRPSHWNQENHTFWSCEPLMAPWSDREIDPARSAYFPEWVILGAETGSRKGKVIPEKSWIDLIVKKCRAMGAAVFMKDSLIPIVGEEGMLREFPESMGAAAQKE